MIGEKPLPQPLLMPNAVPEWIPRQMDERQFVTKLENIPEKYRHLMLISVAAAISNKTACSALSSIISVTVTPALEWFVGVGD